MSTPYDYRFYCFTGPSAFLAAAVAAGWTVDGEGGATPADPRIAVDVVGKVFEDVVGADPENPPPPAELEGFYVNVAWPKGQEAPEFVAAKIDWFPGLRTFAGWNEVQPEPVPVSVTNAQARAVLLTMPGVTPGKTLFDDINEALTAGKEASASFEQRMAWQFWEQANDFTRNGVLVNALAQQFGVSDADLDTLFREAAKITA